jgi:dihydrofolate reductase
MYKIVVACCEPTEPCGDLKGIGFQGRLPWTSCKEDMRHFAQLTKQDGPCAVIMGRKTFESLPNRLVGRQEIVLSYTLSLTPEQKAAGVKVFTTLAALDTYCLDAMNAGDLRHCWVIGGSDLYQMFLTNDLVSDVYISDIDVTLPCDTYFDTSCLRNRFVENQPYQHECWAMDVDCKVVFRHFQVCTDIAVE